MATLHSYALTTVADVKETLGIESGDSSKNNLIIRKINQATDIIEGYCGYDTDHHIKQATYTNEVYDGTGSSDLVLRAKPITAVSGIGVRSSSQNIDNWDDISANDYYFSEHSGLIQGLFGFLEHPSLYRISYTAGYDPIPSDLAEACVSLATFLVDNGATGNTVKTKREGQRSIEYFQPAQSASLIEQLGIDDVLDRYIIPSVAGR